MPRIMSQEVAVDVSCMGPTRTESRQKVAMSGLEQPEAAAAAANFCSMGVLNTPHANSSRSAVQRGVRPAASSSSRASGVAALQRFMHGQPRALLSAYWCGPLPIVKQSREHLETAGEAEARMSRLPSNGQRRRLRFRL